HDLQTAFRATLEELDEADLLVHVVDAADPEHEAHIEAVERILEQLQLAETPRLLVMNKIDRLPRDIAAARVAARRAIGISALEAETTRPLLAAVEHELWREDRLPRDERDAARPVRKRVRA